MKTTTFAITVSTGRTTVRELLAQLEQAEPSALVAVVKAKKEPGECWCGCGGHTKSRFVPGHDSRFHSAAKQVARGTLNLDDELAKLPHEDSRELFRACVAEETPKHEARVAEEAAAAKVKADKAAEKAQAKVDAEAAKANADAVAS